MIINSAKYSCAAGHEINEDSLLCSAERGVFIVADGLGGHSDGEKASLAAVDYFDEKYLGGCNNELITQLMEGANTEVLKKGDGGKTTVAAAFTENGHFMYANAGDSRVYYFRDGRIIAQTKDHSVCQASVDMGMIRPEDIRGNEDRSRLLKVLGSEESLNIKKAYQPIKIQNGDAFLLCSDGFWEYVYETEMEADLLKSDNSDTWLKYMLKRHILRAENKGDNYTAICGIIYLDGSESFVLPAGETVQKFPEENPNRGLVPIIAVGALAVAAAICFLAFLNGRTPSDEPQISETPTILTTEETTVKESESQNPVTTTVTKEKIETTATAPTTAETEPTKLEKNPENEIEKVPDDGVEMKPDDGAEMKPDDGAEMKPDDGAEMKPDDGSEMKPNDGAEMKPENEADKNPQDKADKKSEDEAEKSPEADTENTAASENVNTPDNEKKADGGD